MKRLQLLCFLAVCNSAWLSAQLQWQALGGPNGFGKTVNQATYAADGSIFMVAQNTQVLSSTDDGQHWLPTKNGIPADLGVRLLRDTFGQLYAYSTSYNGKIYRYRPNSKDWAHLDKLGVQGPHPTFDFISITASGRIFFSAKQPNSVIYYSNDGGQTQTELPLDGSLEGWVHNFTVRDDGQGLLITGTGPGIYAMYHFDAGGHVEQVSTETSGLNSIVYNPYSGTAFYSTGNVFKRSTDGGLNWQSLVVPGGQFSVANMQFEPSGRIYAGSSSPWSYYSDDDGQSWKSESKTRHFKVGAHKWLYWDEYADPELGISLDDAQTYQNLSQVQYFPRIWGFQTGPDGTFYAKTNGTPGDSYMRSVDGGQHWELLTVMDTVPKPVYLLSVGNDGTLIGAAWNASGYFISQDRGLTWQKKNAPAILYQITADSKGNFYWVGSNSILKSSNRGQTWAATANLALSVFTRFFFPSNGDIIAVNIATNNQHVYWNATTRQSVNLTIGGTADFRISTAGANQQGDFYCYVTTNAVRGLYHLNNNTGVLEALNIPAGFSVFKIIVAEDGQVYLFSNTGGIRKSSNRGQSWEDWGSFPVTSALQGVYTGPDGHLTLTFMANLPLRSVDPLDATNFIMGRVWEDANGDCLYQPNEKLLGGVALNASGTRQFTNYSAPNGSYQLRPAAGTYTLSVLSDTALYEPCNSPQSVQFTGVHDTVWVDMPVKARAKCAWLAVNTVTLLARRCFSNQITVFYQNKGQETAPNAFLEVTLDSALIYRSSSWPSVMQTGQTLRFALGALPPFSSGSIRINYEISCQASLGATHCILSNLKSDAPACLVSLPETYRYEECRRNIGSFDPNDKTAFVIGKVAESELVNGRSVDYLIRFQNTGTDTAFTVIIEDPISPLLDLRTVQLIGASHPCKMDIKGENILRFTFSNISLPDSNINEAASHGFVKFNIQPKANIPLYSRIENKAGIYFDFNAPVLTNLVSLKVVPEPVSAVVQPETDYHISATPNPFRETIQFQAVLPVPEGAHVQVYDAGGRMMIDSPVAGTVFSVEGEALTRGFYIYLIRHKGRTLSSGKIVKME